MSLPEVRQENQLQRTEKSIEQEIMECRQKYLAFITRERLITTRKAEVMAKLKEFDDLYHGLTKENFKVYKRCLKAHAAEIEEKLKVYKVCLGLEAYAGEIKEEEKAYKLELEDLAVKMNGKLKEIDDLNYERTLKKLKIKKQSHSSQSHSSFKVINIDGENEAIDGDADNSIRNKNPKQDDTVWGTFFAVEFGIASCLGNPLEKLPKLLESRGKVKQQSNINFGEAFPVYAPCMTLSAMFLLNFIYTRSLTPHAFRVPVNSILLLLLVYCILALAEAMSGSCVVWGSTQIPALLFVSGGTIGFMIMVAKFYFTPRFSPN